MYTLVHTYLLTLYIFDDLQCNMRWLIRLKNVINIKERTQLVFCSRYPAINSETFFKNVVISWFLKTNKASFKYSNRIYLFYSSINFGGKVHIFWEGHKILRNLPLTFTYTVYSIVKSKGKTSQIFVAFSEYMNLIYVYVFMSNGHAWWTLKFFFCINLT